MRTLRILFTSVGRRVELLQAFKSAAEEQGVSLQIIGTDVTKTAPALSFCNKSFLVCKIVEKNYIPQLLSICEREHVDALIPTLDTDLLILSQHKSEFTHIGTRVIVSDEEKIRICRDKRLTADYFSGIGLKSPHPVDDYTQYTGGYPAFIKPKDGSSSIFAYKVTNETELAAYAQQVPDYIIQPFITGIEYTVDILCDFDGKPIYITPRIRTAVRAGEVLKTELCHDHQIIEEMKTLIADYHPCGAITVQLIREKETALDYYIEINPRFGGGAPLSMKAGANSASALIRLLCGEKISYLSDNIPAGGVYSRFDQSICVNDCKQPVKAVIFDLDDTLYSEKEYVYSGYHAVAEVLPQVKNATEKMWQAFQKGKPAIDAVLKEENIYSEDLKVLCLNTYRKHMPEISLYPGVMKLLTELRQKNIRIGILTDGRPVGQRNKIAALRLSNMVDEIIVTDEIGGEIFRKPNDISYRIMQRKFKLPFSQMMYVGDNLSKDFIAPIQLGMQRVWFHNSDGIYARSDIPFVPYINKIDHIETLLSEVFRT